MAVVLCVDCRYHALGNDMSHICTHSSAVDVVDGKASLPATKMRSSSGACGPAGQLFEANTTTAPAPPDTAN